MVESLTLTVDFKNAALIAHITELHKAISRIATEYDRIDLKQCDTSTLWRFAGVSRAIGILASKKNELKAEGLKICQRCLRGNGVAKGEVEEAP